VRQPIPCPRCGAEVRGDQAWCLECGLAARTRLAAIPNWRAPLAAAGAVGLACIVALIVAFVSLTGDNAPVPSTSSTPAPAVPTTPTAVAPTTITVPVTTTPTPTVPPIPTTTVAPVATTG
jgi:hypothetical protein